MTNCANYKKIFNYYLGIFVQSSQVHTQGYWISERSTLGTFYGNIQGSNPIGGIRGFEQSKIKDKRHLDAGKNYCSLKDLIYLLKLWAISSQRSLVLIHRNFKITTDKEIEDKSKHEDAITLKEWLCWTSESLTK